MAFNLNQSTFAQGIDEISSTQKLPLGTIRYDAGGMYVYSENTADVALRQGELLIVDPCNADAQYSFDAVPTNTAAELGPGGSYAISQVINVPLGSNGATQDAGYYAGMHLFVDDGTGEGQYARIAGNTAAVSGAAFKIYLQTALATALTVAHADDITIVPEHVVTEAAVTVSTQRVVGIAPMAVTASYFFWRQVSGVCPVLIGEAGTVLYGLTAGDDTAGQAMAVDAADTSDLIYIFGEIMIVAAAADTFCIARINCL